ncbi:MAG: diguanylate cyclase [Clostridiales bacterium]|nr:diguanylate cyclase [Clostridiales bacterium]MBO4578638.1 diguanylate cyclase [Clostridiales bacterium]
MQDKFLSETGNEYKLIWSDEFDGLGINPLSWKVETHPAGWMEGDKQEFSDTPYHVYVENSMLIIKPSKVISSDGSISYTSGRITTFGLHEFKYGKFEASIKMPAGKGLLPVFELIPSEDYSIEEGSCDFPASGRITCATVFNSDLEHCYSGIGFGNPLMTDINKVKSVKGNLSDEFHTYTCEWEPGLIRFLLDGEEYHRVSYWYSAGEDGEIKPYPAPFNKEFFICIYLSIGTLASGIPDNKEVFDMHNAMCIDYIKVWQRDEYDENVTCPKKKYDMRQADPTGNYISDKKEDWSFHSAQGGEGRVDFDYDRIVINSTNYGDVDYAVQFYQSKVPIEPHTRYMLSFEAKADEDREISVAVTAPDMNWKRIMQDRKMNIERKWQKHVVCFESDEDCYDNARLEFNIGNMGSVATLFLRNIRIEKKPLPDSYAKPVAICGAWDDSDNYNMFVEAVANSKYKDRFFPVNFTFGVSSSELVYEKTELEFAGLIRRVRPVALIIFAEIIKNEEVIEQLIKMGKEENIPVFTVQKHFDGCINLDFNYASGFEKMVRHVIEDHKVSDVMMFAGFRDNRFSEERIEVYRKVLSENGIAFKDDMLYYGDFRGYTVSERMEEMISQGKQLPKAIICANDSMAIGVCTALRKNGYRVPEDVLVTGFDGIVRGRYNIPVLSTCSIDYADCVDTIYKILEDHEAGKGDYPGTVMKEYSLLPRCSCGCQSKDSYDSNEVIDALSRDIADSTRHMLELGRLTSKIINKDDVDVAGSVTEQLMQIWNDEYSFVGVTEKNSCIHAVYAGTAESCQVGCKYYGSKSLIPDMEFLTDSKGPYKILLCKQISTAEGSAGLIFSAYKDIDLRAQQRFEELSLFMSSMIDLLINNRALVQANSVINDISRKDYLTGLYNRRGFTDALKKMIGNNENSARILSLISVDLDNLKIINDNYGHDAGDFAIRGIARAITAIVGKTGICARFGGDEFVCAITGNRWLAPERDNIRSRIHDHLENDTECQSLPFKVVSSIGISEHIIDDTLNINLLMREADTQMYADKQSHKTKSIFDL